MLNIWFYDTVIGKIGIISNGKYILKIFIAGVGYQNERNCILKEDDLIQETYKQISEYLSGIRYEFTIPLFLSGTEFQNKVWSSLKNIPYGKTVSYSEIGKMLFTKCYRAVGNALNKNPYIIILPCHRVISKSGSIGGYSYGVEIKKILLDIEKSSINY